MNNAIEVLLYDRNGARPNLCLPAIDSVNWILNRTGSARLFLPYSDPLCNKVNLAYGNRALLRFGNGLPPFGGVIDMPRTRSEAGVTFTVYTGERILRWRITNKIQAYTSKSPGYIARSLLTEADQIRDTGIIAGAIQTDGAVRTEAYNYANVLDALDRLARQSGEDFYVLPILDPARLTFELHWRTRMGEDLDDIAFIEGTNIGTPLEMTEQGPVASIVRQVGGSAGGTEWVDRLVGTATSDEAETTFGYREAAQIQSGIFDQATLDATAETEIAILSSSRKHLRLIASNMAPALFSQYQIGDRCTVQAYLTRPGWEYDAIVRIVGRRWTPANTCQLEVVEW